MENRTAIYIKGIEHILNSEYLTAKQRETLCAFDRFNELEASCSFSTRKNYLDTLHKLGAKIRKPFEERANGFGFWA